VDPVSPEGIESLRTALKGLSANLNDSLREAFRDQALMIARNAQGLVPVRSGHAKASIGVDVINDEVTLIAGGARAPYFGWLEFGGQANHAKRPFVKGGRYLGKATDAAIGDIEFACLAAVIEGTRREGLDGT